MNVYLTASDVAPFLDGRGDVVPEAKLSAMLTDAHADAFRVAPCLVDLDTTTHPYTPGQVRSILRAAVLRWLEAGSGAFQTTSQSVGPWQQSATVDSRQQRRGMFWPSEIAALQSICVSISGGQPRGYNVDTVAVAPSARDALYCFTHDTDEWGDPA